MGWGDPAKPPTGPTSGGRIERVGSYPGDVRLTITRRFRFSAAHFLPDDPSPCRRMHGHNFEGWVTIEGVPDDHGMIVSFDRVKTIAAIAETRLDHDVVNEAIPEIRNPTTELLAGWLLAHFRDHGLHAVRVRLRETENNEAEAEWTG